MRKTQITYRLDCVISSIGKLLNIIRSNTVFREAIKILVGHDKLKERRKGGGGE